MKVNRLYYLVTLAIMVAVALASDCSTIKNKIKKALDIDDELIEEKVHTCKENSGGKVISLDFTTDMELNQIKDVIAYNTLTKLRLDFKNDSGDEPDNKELAKLFDDISKLTNLQEL